MKNVVILCLIFFSSSAFAQLSVSNLLCENKINPVGVGEKQPRFTWQINSPIRNTVQTAYEIRVADNTKNLAGKSTWASGKVNSDSSVHVAYKGSPLQSGKKYHWQVRVWDNNGKTSAWSVPSTFQTGLFSTDEFRASWIQPGYTEDTIFQPSPLLRKEFAPGKSVQSATAFITAHGMYEAYINGRRVGDAYLTPGWTVYPKRLQYQTYDVTNLLSSGKNAIAVTLGSGWYRGFIGFSNSRNFYGKDISLLFQLNINYSDGTTETIISDGSWKSSTGEIRSSEIYLGEVIDARQKKDGWMQAGYNDNEWSGVKLAEFSKANLVATYNEPVKKHELFRPVKFITTPRGEKVIDFGQNLVGWPIIKLSGKAGDTITISHAEVLDKKGNFYTENLRAATSVDKYVLKGGGAETFEPHFTFHGFRYIRIEGLKGEIDTANFSAVALYSDMKPTGSFTSSHQLINQLQHNIQWGQKGNFVDIPTDCPQRDERLGWTGDAQVFARTAAYNMNVNSFFAKWLKDVAADQQPNGSVPFVIPNVLGPGAGASTGWADAATIIPWNMYQVYGDKRILEDQYPSMKAWVDYMKNQSKNDLWNTGFHFGDWLSFMQDNDLMGRSAITDKYLIAQCFWAHSTQLLINTAKVLGKNEDAEQYTAQLKKIKDAFLKEYVTSTGRLVSGTQTAYVLALNFDMLPDSMRAATADRLAQNITNYGNHLTTGFLGTPYLCHVLSRFGKTDVAYQLLLRENYPSWLYPVKMGATTIWERWNGIRPDSTFEPASMNSFNHYAYGAIGDWMYRVVAGLNTDDDKPGYKHIIIKPTPGGNFTNVAADLQTYYGKVSSGWKLEGENATYSIEIPANTRATIYIPSGSGIVTEGGKPLENRKEFGAVSKEDKYLKFEVGSGSYSFVTKK